MYDNPVLRSIQPVVENAEYVEIDDNAVDRAAEQVAEEDLDVPTWDWGVLPDRDWPYNDRIRFLGIGSLLQFCFKDPETGEEYRTEYDGDTYERSQGIWASLRRGMEDDDYPDLMDPSQLRSLEWDDDSPEESDVYRFFDPDTSIPLMKERHEMLRQTGYDLMSYNDRMLDIVKRSRGKLFDGGDGFIDRLTADFEAFQDENSLNIDGETYDVVFNKRAQLFALMLHGHFQDESYLAFDDIDQLAVPSDYRLPQTLESDGMQVLQFDDDLRSRIQQKQPLEPGSREEIEIRAGTIEAAERIIQRANQEYGADIGVPELDFFLWTAGREIDDEEKRPHMMVETVAY